jgi:hypothetical protein
MKELYTYIKTPFKWSISQVINTKKYGVALLYINTVTFQFYYTLLLDLTTIKIYAFKLLLPCLIVRALFARMFNKMKRASPQIDRLYLNN